MPRAEMKALLLQALEALKMADAGLSWYQEEVGAAIAALESAIREQPSEPFGWAWTEDGEWQFAKALSSIPENVTPLYAVAPLKDVPSADVRLPSTPEHDEVIVNSYGSGHSDLQLEAYARRAVLEDRATRGVAPLKDEGEALFSQIMNLPCKQYDGTDAYTHYCRGHRDARHAAAELVSAALAAKDKP